MGWGGGRTGSRNRMPSRVDRRQACTSAPLFHTVDQRGEKRGAIAHSRPDAAGACRQAVRARLHAPEGHEGLCREPACTGPPLTAPCSRCT